MAQNGIEPLGEVLHCRAEREASKLRKARVPNRRPELEMAELLETFPGWHAGVLFQRVVPRLRRAAQVVGGEPCAIRGQGLLATEELLTVVEPVQGIVRAVIRHEL